MSAGEGVLVGFVGDVHGRVFHMLAALATCQTELSRQFDLMIQVGDLGAYPDPARMDAFTLRYMELDPSEADFSRLLTADGRRADDLHRLRKQFSSPVHFIRGNHEDFDWLRGRPLDGDAKTAEIDPFDVFRYVPDGTVLNVGGLRLAFVGGVEALSGGAAIDDEAYERVASEPAGSIDILVTHDPPFGVATGHHGQTQGSQKISHLLELTEPEYHLAGHLHHIIGPRAFGRTTYLGLSSLVASARWEPDASGLKAGCIAVLDTATGDLRPVTEPWLSDFKTSFKEPFDFEVWLQAFEKERS